MNREFSTEEEAITALRCAGYEAYNAAAYVYIKSGYKVKVVRNSWKAKYFVVAYE